ncbi:methyltransferase domain-containing protein [Lysobacter capsici]|uniref:methyltransferase domain-containing protein n=1 Tax=Lysobacter capsici TaxID=435897 RepID=UPI001BFFF99F|nr:methyltransferase domain-containing protein [Lysobacter capsici]QWF16150.1 methyltransferase domain-containing protein [Lysobacter capsici]
MASGQEHLISAEEVMRRVRSKLGVERLTATVGTTTASEFGGIAQTGASGSDFTRKSQYLLGDLVRYDDAEFVANVYRAVLMREPDGAAFDYLRALRSGALSKVELLGRIRWSEEGVARAVHIDGLMIPYKLRTWRRIPVLGPALAWVIDVTRLSTLLDRSDTHVGVVSGDLQQLREHMAQVVGTHRAKIASIEEALVRQPSIELIDALNTRIDALAERLTIELGRQEKRAADGGARTSSTFKNLDSLYADFEDQFRGSQEQIRQRLQPYLKFVSDLGAGTESAPVLDLGCGRGEWLEMLMERGLVASGVDLNQVFVNACKSKHLNVSNEDAIEKLSSLPDQSLGLISLFHLAEHLPFEVMIELFDQALRVLVPGGGMIVETPNAENALVAQWGFYMDPTHRNPLPPEMLRWMIQSRGFAQADILRLFEARPEPGIAFVADDVAGACSINALIEPTRAAFDYAIVARKSVSVQ